MIPRQNPSRWIARKKFERLIAETIKEGTLVIDDPDGQRYRAGNSSGKMVHIRIENWNAVLKLVLHPDLALGEAYMSGDLTMVEGEIYDLLDLVFRNLGAEEAPGPSRFTRALFRFVLRFVDYNSPEKSKDNVAHHYDLDGRLYDLFLDADKQYSCGYFETPESSLEDSQLAKKRHLAAKLALHANLKVLDIGSGWGGLSLYLAKHFDADVQGVTLSEEQLAISRERAAQENLHEKVKFDLMDYRSLKTRFDRIISVGMFEHVGRRSYSEFFSVIHNLLNDDGVAVLHYIGRTTPPSETNAWILKYIFPGGYMPSLSQVLPEIERQGLVVTDIEVLRLHYAETLAAWRKRFLANKERAAALYDEQFVRMWEFYLATAETGFRYQGLVIHQIQMARDQSALPLVRDYITGVEEKLKERDLGRKTADALDAAE